MPSTTSNESFLEFVPVSLFGGVMGLCGLCFSWRLAEKAWGFGNLTGEVIGITAIISFLLLSVVYAVKWAKYPGIVSSEFQHPVQVCFFATFIVSLLLMPGILLPYFPLLAKIMWIAGTLLIFVFSLKVLRKWLDRRQNAEDALPVWVLPVVGTLDVPIVGSHIQIVGSREICLMFFGIGFVFAVILLVVVISRLFFQEPLPAQLQPTMLILTGPFALAYSGYIEIMGKQDMAAIIMFYFNLFLFLLVAGKVVLLPKTCPFRVSWWSVSFPLTAITVSCFHYAEYSLSDVHKVLAFVMLLITSTIIVYLLVQTIFQIATNTFVPSNPQK
jgi:tellurite resistance protein